ncbi:hypothetical protein BGZ80_004061 [Entomortierella chlamydospora]|uniref:Uncharacterized protein n=1 Tax=Entomortierella chlamydospora TaxID=101097 RepID=A0A9P6MNH7_9FUNG|nr:hypothetical protein BGZ80_004061 [Entomortierella chlamydospora]
MADVNGNVAKIYKIICMNDIHACGEVTDLPVYIPSNEGELLEFICDGGRQLAILWNFVVNVQRVEKP